MFDCYFLSFNVYSHLLRIYFIVSRNMLNYIFECKICDEIMSKTVTLPVYIICAM